MVKNKKSKIWGNETKCVTECNLSLIGEEKKEDNKYEYMIEEYEEKIKELNSTIFSLRTNKNHLMKQIEELKIVSNKNAKLKNNFCDNLNLESFHLNIIHDKKKSWNELLKRHKNNQINIFPKKNIIKMNKMQSLGNFSILGRQKPLNIIEYGDFLEILYVGNKKFKNDKLSFDYGDEIFIPGKSDKKVYKNKMERLKGFNILKKPKIKSKNRIEKLNGIKIIPKENPKLKNKPKFNNIIETTNNIYIPRKAKELFTWDTFYGQELYILSNKKKKALDIDFLDGLEILKVSKPENEIEFNEPFAIMPEPKAPLEINYVEELYIPESIKKLKSPQKPSNKIVYRDKIRLLGKKLGNNIVQKVSLVEIYSVPKPKIIEYEEKESIFIPGIVKPENIIYFNDEIEIIHEKLLAEYKCEACDNIDLLGLEPEFEEERLESFDIYGNEKQDIIDERRNLEITFGEEIIIESELRPENEIQSLQGFDLFKKQKPLNKIEIRDDIELLGEESPQLNLTLEEIDLFTINQLEKPKNKLQRVSEVKILKKTKNKYINRLFKSGSLSILSKKKQKPRNYIQNTECVNILGLKKENINEIVFNDEMIIEGLEKPLNTIQRTQEVKIIKKPKIKIKNTKQKSSEFQILKKAKPKQKNRIQKNDSVNIYPEQKLLPIKNDYEIVFGDEVIILQIEPNNEIQSLKGFNILKKKKPLNEIEIQINEEIQILPRKKISKNQAQRANALSRCQKVEEFIIKPKQIKLQNINKKKITENIIDNTANFQIISVCVRELYQQRLQGFVIYKKDKEPNEIEKNYSFIIKKEYDALLARPLWDNLYIQKEDYIITSNPSKIIRNKNILTNEVQDDFLIEANSLNSKYKESYINDSFTNTNSRDLSVDICKVCGGRKIYENNSNYNCSYRNKNEYKKVNNIYSANKKVNVTNNQIYKTLLALPQNEIDYINNIEIGPENLKDRVLFSDDEFIKEKTGFNKRKYRAKNKNNTKYDNKSYDININKKSKNINNLNFTNSEICNYSKNTEEKNLKQNMDSNYRINKKFITNTMLRKKYYKYNNKTSDNNISDNDNDNNNFYQSGTSQYTYYKNCTNSRQNKTQLKTMVINHNRKRKLFRFEEGKGIKVIYQ